MKVLITGGTGTISSGLVYESVKRNYETYAITRGNDERRNIEGANYLHADIWNTNSVKSVIGELKFDVVVECLAYNVVQLKKSLQNFSGVCNQYVFISTAAVYNRKENKRVSENDEKDFVAWSYTKDKIECEKYLKNYSQKTGLRYTIVRPTVTYGDYRIPFPIATRTPGWTFFDRMKKGQLMLASDNVQFSIIHISDFSKMVVSLFENNKAINNDFHITSNNNDIYWDDVIKKSGEILNVEPRIIHVSSQVIRHMWPDIYDEIQYHKNTSQIFDDKKIKNATDKDAEIDLGNGLSKTILAMEDEYNDNNFTLDNEWNDNCNAVIYYAYKKRELSKKEMDIVSEYIDKYTDEDFIESYKKVIKYNRVRKIRLLKGKIKCIIKKVLRDNE